MQHRYQRSSYRCMPPTARDYDCQDKKKALIPRTMDAVVAREGPFRAVQFPPFQRATQELYDMHFSSIDCTHFCYMPGFVEAGIHLINEAIVAAAAAAAINGSSSLVVRM